MQRKHKKALSVTLLVAVLALLPLGYLWHLYQNDLTAEMGDLGSVEEFAFQFDNRQGGITSFDTRRQATLVAILRDHCAQDCAGVLVAMRNLRQYVEDNLTEKNHDVPTPLPIRFVAMATPGTLKDLPEGWDLVAVKDSMPYLVPATEKDNREPAFVIIDDASRYRAFLPINDPLTQEKAERLLGKITSHQFLIHYLVKQTLMWQKAKDVARGTVQ